MKLLILNEKTWERTYSHRQEIRQSINRSRLNKWKASATIYKRRKLSIDLHPPMEKINLHYEEQKKLVKVVFMKTHSLVREYKAMNLTLILLTWTIWRAPTNASKWRMGFNSAFKGLNFFEGMVAGICPVRSSSQFSVLLRLSYSIKQRSFYENCACFCLRM